ncbi:MAG: hypothetical protein M3R14_09250 [Acidobacteriota bacterium]|nr:hypothetical protein [Acidobacteriota bacterium]
MPNLICRSAAHHNAGNDFRQFSPKLSLFFPETFVTCLFAARYDAAISKRVGSCLGRYFQTNSQTSIEK